MSAHKADAQTQSAQIKTMGGRRPAQQPPGSGTKSKENGNQRTTEEVNDRGHLVPGFERLLPPPARVSSSWLM